MKKLFTITAVALFGLTVVNAQDVKFGAKAGINVATLNNDNKVYDVESITAFHIGVMAEIMLSDKFSFQPELMYSSQGAVESSSINAVDFAGEPKSSDYETEYKLDYINLPLMAKYYVTEGLSLEAGPQIGFLLNSEADFKYSDTADGTTDSGSGTNNLKDFTSTIDFGLNFGLGYKLDNGLNFSARYNLGLSNVNDFPGSDDNKSKNSVLQVSVGFFF